MSLLAVKKKILKNLFNNLKFHQKIMIFQGFNSLVLYNKFCLLQENLNKTAADILTADIVSSYKHGGDVILFEHGVASLNLNHIDCLV